MYANTVAHAQKVIYCQGKGQSNSNQCNYYFYLSTFLKSCRRYIWVLNCQSKRGYWYILTFIIDCTRWPEALLFRTLSSKTVADAYMAIVCSMRLFRKEKEKMKSSFHNLRRSFFAQQDTLLGSIFLVVVMDTLTTSVEQTSTVSQCKDWEIWFNAYI